MCEKEFLQSGRTFRYLSKRRARRLRHRSTSRTHARHMDVHGNVKIILISDFCKYCELSSGTRDHRRAADAPVPLFLISHHCI